MKQVSMWILVSVFAVIAGFSNLVFAYSVRQTVDLATGNSHGTIASVGLLCAVLLLATMLINFLKDVVTARFLYNTSINNKQRVFRAAFDETNTKADFVSALTNDMNTLENEFYLPIINCIMYVSMFIFASGTLLFYNIIHGLLMIFVAAVSVAVTMLFRKKLGDKRMQISDAQSEYTSKIKDMLYGLNIVRQFLALPKVAAEHDKVNKSLEQSKRRFSVYMAKMDAISTVISMFMFISSFLLGGYYVLIGIYTLGMMMAAIQLVNNIVIPMGELFSL
ncbi:MAG: ABC transporter transmembrane domain-containing protein [Lachnospiraceae bacterium]|nr:ABC transporter transmembrane domain-containing protein [Lachnospiraceae bacterium]